MAHAIFRAISNLRLVLDTETDADSPDNETTYDAIREMIEDLYQILLATSDDGTATQNPPNDTTGVLTDAAGGYSVDEHNGRTLVMTSGLAKGSFYTIDDTTATTLVCTDDNLYADGVRSGDDYVVLYDIKVNTDGHNHDGVNSANVALADRSVAAIKIVANSLTTDELGTACVAQDELAAAAVGQGELKTGTSSVGVAGVGSGYGVLTGGYYNLFMSSQVKTAAGTYASVVAGLAICTGGPPPAWVALGNSAITIATPDAYVSYYNDGGAGYYAYGSSYYITASDIYSWLFLLSINGNINHIAYSDDHPRFGSFGKRDHPFGCGDKKILKGFFNNEFAGKDVELIVINPTIPQMERIKMGTLPAQGGGYMSPGKAIQGIEVDYDQHKRPMFDAFNDIFEIEQTNQADWIADPISIGLPQIHNGRLVSDWRTMPKFKYNPETKKEEPLKIKTVKKVITKPDYITPLQIKLREGI